MPLTGLDGLDLPRERTLELRLAAGAGVCGGKSELRIPVWDHPLPRIV